MHISRAEASLVRPFPAPVAPAPPPVPAASDEELIRRMRRGDEAALMALYDRYAGYVSAIAIRILSDRQLAEEVVQDTFLRSWDHVDAYESSRGRVIAWLTRIARNRAIDLLRSRSHQARRREAAPLSETVPAAATDVTDVIALHEALTAALAALPPEQRHVIELAYYGGLTQAEISEQLGTPLGTVKTRTRAAMDRLRVALHPFVAPDAGDER